MFFTNRIIKKEVMGKKKYLFYKKSIF